MVDGALNGPSRRLFTSAELAHHAFLHTCSPDARRLYVRLSQRRARWFRLAKIEYEEISDVPAAMGELVAAGLALDESSIGASERGFRWQSR